MHLDLKTNKDNSKVSSGIENLFSEENFHDSFYMEQPKTDGGKIIKLDKKKFLNHMMKFGTKDDFKKFQPLIDKIKELRD